MLGKQETRAITLAVAVGALFFAPLWLTSPAYAADVSSQVGVVVEATVPPTTLPPTTTPPPTTVLAPVTRGDAADDAPTTSTTIATPQATVPATTDNSLLKELEGTLPDPAAAAADAATAGNATQDGFVSSVKSAARTTKRLFSGVLGGKPVASVAGDVLPTPVADVVVPAVRTASTFAFPIGLAGAVLAFLALQQRVDAGDPKLAAAPIAHDDDVVTFS